MSFGNGSPQIEREGDLRSRIDFEGIFSQFLSPQKKRNLYSRALNALQIWGHHVYPKHTQKPWKAHKQSEQNLKHQNNQETSLKLPKAPRTAKKNLDSVVSLKLNEIYMLKANQTPWTADIPFEYYLRYKSEPNMCTNPSKLAKTAQTLF